MRLTGWLTRERFSWVHLALMIVVWAMIDALRTGLGWPWWLADITAIGGVLAAAAVIGGVHGICEGLRGQAD